MKGVSIKDIESVMLSDAKPGDIRPDPSVYDPMMATHWTPLEAIVWIATRDVNVVRDVAPFFRANWVIWKRKVQDYPYDEDGNWSPFLPGTLTARTRLIWRQCPVRPACFCDAAKQWPGVGAARADLWSKLSQGRIAASGLKGRIQFDGAEYSLDQEAMRPLDAERQEIDARNWTDLHMPSDTPRALSEGPMGLNESRALNAVRLFDWKCDGPDAVRSARGVLYFDVRLPATQILAEWELRNSLDELLLAEANRKGGTIGQKNAEQIARTHGFLEKREEIISRIKALNIDGKQGRKSVAR
jgi:hypothetical protein